MDGDGPLAAGRSAPARGDWPAARQVFQAAWDDRESADALDGLGLSLWWLGDAPAALDARSRAFALLRSEGRDRDAAMVGIWLARQYRACSTARQWRKAGSPGPGPWSPAWPTRHQ